MSMKELTLRETTSVIVRKGERRRTYYRARRASNVELRLLDPGPKVAAGRFLQLVGEQHLDLAQGREIVLVLVRRQPLVEGLLGDVVLAHRALAADRFDLDAGQRVDHLLLGRPLAAARARRL